MLTVGAIIETCGISPSSGIILKLATLLSFSLPSIPITLAVILNILPNPNSTGAISLNSYGSLSAENTNFPSLKNSTLAMAIGSYTEAFTAYSPLYPTFKGVVAVRLIDG